MKAILKRCVFIAACVIVMFCVFVIEELLHAPKIAQRIIEFAVLFAMVVLWRDWFGRDKNKPRQ